MVKYKTGYNFSIQEIEVAGETPKFVKLKCGRKEAKMSDYGCYFESFDDAKAFLMDRAISRVQTAELRLKLANEDLQKVKGL
jgi:hypothetical protein